MYLKSLLEVKYFVISAFHILYVVNDQAIFNPSSISGAIFTPRADDR
jgi:hypothetical protein